MVLALIGIRDDYRSRTKGGGVSFFPSERGRGRGVGGVASNKSAALGSSRVGVSGGGGGTSGGGRSRGAGNVKSAWPQTTLTTGTATATANDVCVWDPMASSVVCPGGPGPFVVNPVEADMLSQHH